MPLQDVYANVHEPVPPYKLIAGPIALRGQERKFTLSKPQTASIEIAAADVLNPDWLRRGMYWGIGSELGQPYWAGSVSTERLKYRADRIRLPLLGPLHGILANVDAPSGDMTDPQARSTRELVLEALDQAAARHGGVLPGRISTTSFVDFSPLGETVSQLIEALHIRTGDDYYEETQWDGATLRFLLHVESNFGRETGLVVSEILDGEITRNRLESSVEVISVPVGQSARAVSSTDRHGGAGEFLVGEQHRQPVEDRDIGPAATRHAKVFDGRLAGLVMQETAFRSFVDRLRSAEQVSLVLDLERSDIQNLRVGDIFRLEVAGWYLNVDIAADVQVRELVPHEESGKLDAVCWVRL